MADDLFWRCTLAEVHALLREIGAREQARERAAALRAGLVAASIYNVNLKKGARPLRPQDFLRERTRVLSRDQAERLLDAWSRGVNARGGK